ncbi:unnamed protein product [Clonostachys byssicola]|uniref:Uncharacterized protein n=1 Tax=Clonostachys byssicola TaxID=160290 RepID=A0A9N9UR68_9HYPO|nr:unnamed protein product [Clonostachys byssicola]
MNGLKAWFTKGPAQDTYKKNILPELEHLLENCGLPEGDPLFLRDYMIGLSASRAVPTVMICCIDENIRAKAKRFVSDSGIVKSHGFKLGCSALCLEAKTIPIKCMKESLPDEERDESHDSETISTILGGRVFFQNHDNGNLRAATAGPVVMLGGAVYQLTVAHILLKEDKSVIGQERRDLDEFELESDHDEYGLELGGCGMEGSISSGDTSEENDLDEKGISSTLLDNKSSRDGVYQLGSYRRWGFKRLVAQLLDRSRDESRDEVQQPAKLLCPSRHIEADVVSSFPKPNHTLDYLLFAISHAEKPLPSSVRTMNTVHPDMYNNSDKSKNGHPTLEIRQAVAIDSSEKVVMLITAVGAVSGRLIPGTTSYRQSGKTTFQKIHIVLTESPIYKGDCGAAVIDASTGHFYGHIVLGVPGTFLAYIIPSVEVLQDIKNQTGLEASLDVSQFQNKAKHEPPRKKIKSFGDEFHSHLAERPLFSQEQHGESEPEMVCPFFRLDPFRYQKCYLSKLRRFSDVKQHLELVHSRSAYYCPYCQTSWPEEKEWTEHARKGCDKPLAPNSDAITTLDLELLDKIPRDKDDAEKYSIMWKSLFPGPCPNPWRKDSLRECINQIQQIQGESLRRLIPDLLRKYRVSLGHSQTYELIEDIILEVFNKNIMRYPAAIDQQTLDSLLPSTLLPPEDSDFSRTKQLEKEPTKKNASQLYQQMPIPPQESAWEDEPLRVAQHKGHEGPEISPAPADFTLHVAKQT